MRARTLTSPAGECEEIGEQCVTVLRSDALGMELHAEDRVARVGEPHDEPFGLGSDLKAVGQPCSIDDQGVIARHRKTLGQPRK